MQFIAQYLIFVLYVNSRWNGQFLGTFWSREKKRRKLAGTSRCANVATSGQREEEVNKWPMSRCLNVTMPQRRDVSANSALTSLKAKGPEIEGGSENVQTRERKA